MIIYDPLFPFLNRILYSFNNNLELWNILKMTFKKSIFL